MNCRHGEVPNNAALHPIAFSSKSLSSMEQWYSNIEKEALGILHGLIKFQHYCFAKEMYVITDHKLLSTMVSNDAAMLSHWLQHIMLHRHQ